MRGGKKGWVINKDRICVRGVKRITRKGGEEKDGKSWLLGMGRHCDESV